MFQAIVKNYYGKPSEGDQKGHRIDHGPRGILLLVPLQHVQASKGRHLYAGTGH